MLDVSEIFDDSDLVSEIQLRHGAGEFLPDGRWTGQYADPVLVPAIVHPTKPDDLQLLPEGERYLPNKKVFSPSALAIGDLFEYQGHSWRIAALGDWSEYGFFNAIAVRHDGVAQPDTGAFVVT